MKSTNFRSDGQTIENIIEFNPSNEKKIKETKFRSDGTTIDYITEYDLSTGVEIRTTYI
ncbi:hypothetical protein CWO85_01395 [Candidatus Phytoplasma ziziphi]|uniref:DUF2963 domain-containing protein n=1 Tax=Ziziphus jujuba witches'-broom phytoplasma TaxID=135727 RepID=A0A660HND3_ZIZJU|nr:hypothetical protein CWO85_01395 [Candidatus Phytoplasma ziziphi]